METKSLISQKGIVIKETTFQQLRSEIGSRYDIMVPVKAIISRDAPDVVMAASSLDINSVSQQQEREIDAGEETETRYMEAEWNNHLDALGKGKGKRNSVPRPVQHMPRQGSSLLQLSDA